MNKTSLLITSGIITLLVQVAFALGMDNAGIALSAAALPLLLPLTVGMMKKHNNQRAPQLALAC